MSQQMQLTDKKADNKLHRITKFAKICIKSVVKSFTELQFSSSDVHTYGPHIVPTLNI